MRRPTSFTPAALVLVASLSVVLVATPSGAQVLPSGPEAPPTTMAAPTTTTTTPTSTTSTTSTTSATSPTTGPVATPPSTPVSPTTTVPSAPVEAVSTAPKVRGVGDSVFHSAQTRVERRLQPEYRPRFRSVPGALVREMTPAALTMAANRPAAIVFGLSNPDLAEVDDDPGVRLTADAAYLIRRTRDLPCTVWINVKEDGVTRYYNPQWAQKAREFNDYLQAATIDGPALDDVYSPNLHILDWNAITTRHPNWFLPDGLHLNAIGQAGYAGTIDRFLNRVCPP